jgi:hypothetical protein
MAGSMADPDPTTFLSDLLSDVARRERRNLLIASSVGVLMAHIGLLPTQISALGVVFSAPAQSSLLVLMAFVVTYFIAAFFIYGWADFLIWRKRRHDYLVSLEIAQMNWTIEDQHDRDQLNVPSISWWYQWAPRVAYLRAFFEFVLPLLVGLYVLGALLVDAWWT